MPNEVCLPRLPANASSTESASSRETFLSVAIAVPIACTSRASMCFNTAAASCSPSESSNTEARCAPVSFCGSAIFAHPCFHDLCDLLRILARDALGELDFLLESERRRARCAHASAERQCVGARLETVRAGGRERKLLRARWADEIAKQRAQHDQDQPECEQRADALLHDLAHGRLLPERHADGLEIGRAVERRVDDRNVVAALLVETDCVPDEQRHL